MSYNAIPALEIFMAVLGFGFTIMFCTAFCKACHRFREEQMEREEWRRNEAPTSIYFIPLPGNMSHQQSEDHHRPPRYSEEFHRPPQHGTPVYCTPPPSYNEVGVKPEDLPPAYSEHTNVPIYPITPHQTESVQPQPHSQSLG